MALSRHAVATKTDESIGSGAGSLTGFDLDCGTGSDRVALVCVGFPKTLGHTISGVTIGGNAMTAVAVETEFGPGSGALHWFRYVNPGTGNQSVVVSYANGSGNRSAVVVAISYSGGHQTTPTSGYATDVNDSGPQGTEQDITVSSASGAVVIAGVVSIEGVTWTCDTGTELADVQRTANGTIALVVSEEAGAASVTAEHTSSAAIYHAIGGFSLAAAAAGGGVSPLVHVNNMMLT